MSLAFQLHEKLKTVDYTNSSYTTCRNHHPQTTSSPYCKHSHMFSMLSWWLERIPATRSVDPTPTFRAAS